MAALVALLGGTAAPAQTPPANNVVPAYAQAILNGSDGTVVPAGCASCGGGMPTPYITGPIAGPGCGPGGPCACSDDSCASCQCKPGRSELCKCAGGCSDSFLGRFGGGLVECICCPDPCYEGHWSYPANAAFFEDTVRPQTYTRFRWDSGHDLAQPDRGEFFWAKPGNLGGKGPPNIESRVNYDILSLYQEVAAGAFSFFIDAPYIGVDPENNPGHSNFGDLNLGTKTLLLDCELIQFTFQFRTYIPTGISRNGLGTGHTSLEPSFLTSLKLTQDTYLQSQLAYWIPIGGDQDWEGATIWYGTSLNHQWFKNGPFALISTAEINGWTFTDGSRASPLFIPGTPPSAGNAKAYEREIGGETIITVGGGLRLVVCDKIDVGFGVQFAVTDARFADQLYRTEVRFKY